MVQRRTLPALVLLVLGAGTLAACSGATPTAAEATPVDLRFSW